MTSLLQGVSKAYGDKLLYEDLNFNLPQAGIVGIIGPNGAGKTTIFRMIMGEETPDNGIFLQLDGKRNTMVLFLKRRIALVRTFLSDNSPGSSAPDTANHEGPDIQR